MVYPKTLSVSRDFLLPVVPPKVLPSSIIEPSTIFNTILAIKELEKELFLSRREVKENYTVNTNAPANPVKGDRYITGADSVTGSDPWDNKDEVIAEWTGSEWSFVTPTVGMYVYVVGAGAGTYRYNGSTWAALAAGASGLNNNFTATTNPTVDDDDDQTSPGPYGVGSHWVNVTLDTVYVCVDSSNGAAVWTQVSSAPAGPNNNFAATTNPTVNDDDNQTSPGPYAVGSHWINVTLDTVYVCADATNGAAVWTQVSSNYEEGTWTPELTGPGAIGSYNTQVGTYVKIGNKVFVQGRIDVAAIGTLSSSTNLTLPFTAHAVSHANGYVAFGEASGLTIAAGENITGRLSSSGSAAFLLIWSVTTGTANLNAAADLGASPTLGFSLSYTAT